MAISSAGGKGSAKRPSGVSMEEVGANFDRIFGKKKPLTQPLEDAVVCLADIDLSDVTPRNVVVANLRSAAALLDKYDKGQRDESAKWRIEEGLKQLVAIMGK